MNDFFQVITASRRRLDADSVARVAQIRATGATVSDSQLRLMSEIFRAEKIALRWDKLKRFYLPIWGHAAGNAICLKTGTTGSWAGTVTQGAGYVQGNGTTGYFDFGVSPSTLGLGPSSEMVGVLVFETGAAASYYVGAQTGSTALSLNLYAGGDAAGLFTFTANSGVNRTISGRGILAVSRVSTTDFYSHQRRAASVETIAGPTTVAAGGIGHSIVAMARSNSGVISQYSPAKFGSFFAGLGMSVSEIEGFSSGLKTLWEGCTGLALP